MPVFSRSSPYKVLAAFALVALSAGTAFFFAQRMSPQAQSVPTIDRPASPTVSFSTSLTTSPSDSSIAEPSVRKESASIAGEQKTLREVVYVYRESSGVDTVLNPTVVCDGTDLAKLRKGCIFKVELPAGLHSCSCAAYHHRRVACLSPANLNNSRRCCWNLIHLFG